MVIAVNTRLFVSSRLEGVARYEYEVLKTMVADHPEDQFIFFFDRPYDSSFVFADNVKPVIVRPVTRHPILWYLWLEWAIPRALKKYKADVFLSMDTFMSLSTSVPNVMVSHDIAYAHYPHHISFFDRQFYEHYFPKFHKAAKKLVAVSSFTADDIAEEYGIDRSEIAVAYNAVPRDFTNSVEVSAEQIRKQYTDGEKFFVYLGSLHPRKNIVNLIKGYEAYRQNNVSTRKLVLIGRLAWNTQEIEVALQRSKYKKDIIHLSNIGKEAKDIVAASEAMVYVSLFEGFGIPILEAMASGVPVITSNVSSMPEVAGDAALLVNPKSPKDIGGAMSRIINEPGLRNKLIEKGKIRVNYFNWQDSADTIYRLCQEAI